MTAVVYGFRSRHHKNHRRGIRGLEAQFVEVVANAVTAALIRFDREAEASRSRVLLESVFPPAIARELQANPAILEPQSKEVSVLFADLRGFTSISESLGPRQTHQLLAQIMDRFSEIVAQQNGLIIDFYGDGLSAFWNAPFPQLDHATLACRAALEMIGCLPEIDSVWQPRIGKSLSMGIGVHTGVAQVGNSGSRTRLKYGPRGANVNLASRLENLTKRIGIPILISADTACRVANHFRLRWVCRTQLAGIQSPTDVYQIGLEADASGELGVENRITSSSCRD